MDAGVVADRYVARVKGTRGTLPRGYPWVMLVWYAVMGTIIGAFTHGWYGVGAGLLIFASGAALVGFLQTRKTPAFIAHRRGIRLGGQRRSVNIPWREIQEVRISSAAHGVQVDVVLTTPTAPAGRRLPPVAEVLLALLLLGYSDRFLVPPLLVPVTNPARYRAPLWGATADQVAEGLRSVLPQAVLIVQ